MTKLLQKGKGPKMEEGGEVKRIRKENKEEVKKEKKMCYVCVPMPPKECNH